MSFWSKLKHYFKGDYSEWANRVKDIAQKNGVDLPDVSDPFNVTDNTFTDAVESSLAGENSIIGRVFNSGIVKDIFTGISNILDPVGVANRQFTHDENELSYQRQLDLMHYQNDYNTPRAQMQRLAEAGLNPNLMYGQGTTGNTSVSTPEYTPTKSELSYNALETAARGISLYHNIKLQGAQIDNIKAMTDYNRQKAAHEAVATELGQKRLDIENELLSYQLDAAREHARKRQIDNDLKEPQVKYAEENAKLDYLSKKLDIPRKQLEAALAGEGLTTRDSMWIRLVYNILSERKDSSFFGGLYLKFRNMVENTLNKSPYDKMNPEDKAVWDSIVEEEQNEDFYRKHFLTN